MPTKLQITLIHVAASQAGLNKEQYRTLLKNVGGVESSKLLDQSGFEDCMAVIEDCGFRERNKPANYWRQIVARRGTFCSPRMVRKIMALAEESRYQVPSLCLRFSEHRADSPDQLHPREAWNLIEMLKASNARNEESMLPFAAPTPSPSSSSLPPEPRFMPDPDDLPF